MDRWKAEMGRVGEEKRREEKKKEDQERESLRRKRIQAHKKVRNSRDTVFFQWFVAPEGRKAGSLKRRVRSHLTRWEMKSCTPLWDEARFQVKMYKANQVRTTFGNWDVEKVHAVVARSTFPSHKEQNTPWSDHFWKLRCRKSARRCSAKHISKSKCTKHTRFGPLWKLRCRKSGRSCGAKHISKSKVWKTDGFRALLEVEMSKKCTPLWRKAQFEVKSAKNEGCGALLDVQISFCVAGARDCAPCQKWAKCEGFVACPKTMAGVGHLKRICKDAYSVAGAVQETCSSELLGGPGPDFLRGVAFWSVRSSGLLRWFCVTGATICMTWHHVFRAGAVL